VEIVNATVEFDAGPGQRFRALESVSVQFYPGQVTCLVGPSGCGKTTVLNVLAGFVSLSSGSVRWPGGSRPRLGYVFQDYALFPWMTVRENLVFGLRRLGRPELRAQEEDLVRRWLSIVHMEGFEDYYPYQLSGGMKQRVAVARALIYEPDLVLMDEPFGALDELTRQQLVRFLDDLLAAQRLTVAYVTHNLREAAVLGDVVYVMARKPGRIVARVPVDLPRPRGLHGEGTLEVERRLYELVACQVEGKTRCGPRRPKSESAEGGW
jgi:NitT/TauT family transport system ATP-binding protein